MFRLDLAIKKIFYFKQFSLKIFSSPAKLNNIGSILKIDNILLSNQSNLDMKLNHELHLDKYEISIKEKIFIDNQQLESYISDYLLDFIAIF